MSRLQRILVAVATAGSLAAAYLAVATEDGVSVEEVRAEAVAATLEAAVALRASGASQAEAIGVLAASALPPEPTAEDRSRLAAVVEAAYSPTRRDPRGRYAHEVALLAPISVEPAASAALASAYCGPLRSPLPDAGPTPQVAACLEANAGFLAERYCDSGESPSHAGARLRVTEGQRERLLLAAQALPLVVVDPATDEAYSAARAAAGALPCPVEGAP